MSHVEIIEVRRYYPTSVKRIIGRGGGSYIGVIDELTVLKYPSKQGDTSNIRTESQFLKILGCNPRIIGFKDLTDDGLLLAYAKNGDLNRFLDANPFTSFAHIKGVIHCDINLRNLLLDENLDLKLTDFQGMHKSSKGEVLLDGFFRECAKSFQPRVHGDYADLKTDIFALGSAIFFTMTGHEIFPDLDSVEDEEEIERRFRDGEFPVGHELRGAIMGKCCGQGYSSAQGVVDDIISVENRTIR